ncbi:hypothetical protein SESBI_00828 [Sesbania bispinosa]|nr:hypothetical protein SESBI_00828 [Sesbania bispinosa]
MKKIMKPFKLFLVRIILEQCVVMGENVTQTSLKRKTEINVLKEAHKEEVTSLHEKIHNMEDKFVKLQDVVKVLLKQNNPEMDMESLDILLGSSPQDANSAEKVNGQPHVHSSTITHVPNLRKDEHDGGDACEEFEDNAL